jgi:hypothetical protein
VGIIRRIGFGQSGGTGLGEMHLHQKTGRGTRYGWPDDSYGYGFGHGREKDKRSGYLALLGIAIWAVDF